MRFGAALFCAFLFMALCGPPRAHAQTDPTSPNQMGAGCAMVDYDLDGDLDLLYVNTGDGKVQVYRNGLVPDGSVGFTDVTAAVMPTGTPAANGMGVAVGDVNNDGYEDLFVTYSAATNNLDTPYRLFLNKGGTHFAEATRASGLTSYVPGTISSTAAFFDYDRDGDLDLYIGAYATYRRGTGTEMVTSNAKKTFYENTGNQPNGTPIFVDKTDEKNIGWCGGQSEWTLGIGVADYDNDGDMDLYLVNDYGGCNSDGSIRSGDDCMFRNNGDGTFTNVTQESNTNDPGYGMGVDFGDYDNDGDLDLFITNFWYDTLLRNKGDGTFEDVSADVGINESLNGWGAAFRDYDNDGNLDIMNVNGWLTNSWGQVECESNCVWHNEGPGAPIRFLETTEEAGVAVHGDARGAAWGDVNQDGWVDMIVLNNTDWDHSGGSCNFNAPKRLLFENQKNRTFRDISGDTGLRDNAPLLPVPPTLPQLTNHWLTVVPHCVTSNRSGIGTRVTIQAGGKTYLRELGCGSYLSTNERILQFGLGPLTTVDELTIRWPNGNVEHLQNVAADQRLHLTEGQVETPVTLTSFTAANIEGTLAISWAFSDAVDHAGFQLYRRPAGQGEFVRITPRLLTGQASPMTFRDEGLAPGRYEYRLEAIDRAGASSWFGPITAELVPPMAGLSLGQNYPNPFNPTTTIPVFVVGAVPGAPAAEIQVFGPTGAAVRHLPVPTAAGRHELTWDGRDDQGAAVPSGVYYYRLAGQATSHRMLLLK